MGTRSLTVFHDYRWPEKRDVPNEIVVMYRQFDGYPTGHGQELADFLKESKIVNGLKSFSISGESKVFNGMGCLAASVVAYFKEEPGGFYLHKAGTRDCDEEYIYTVYGKDNEEPRIKVEAGWKDMKELFDGFASEYNGELIEASEQEE